MMRWRRHTVTASGWPSGSCRTTTSIRCPTGTSPRARSEPTPRRTRTARSGRPMPTTRSMSRYWSALVVEAGKRYDGHPDLNHVDVSTVGYWGEGWGPYLPELVRPAAVDRPVLQGVPAHAAVDEFRCAAGAAVRREAGRWLAARLLGRHGRAGPQLCAHEGPLSAAARARRAAGRRGRPGRSRSKPAGSPSNGTSGTTR